MGAEQERVALENPRVARALARSYADLEHRPPPEQPLLVGHPMEGLGVLSTGDIGNLKAGGTV